MKKKNHCMYVFPYANYAEEKFYTYCISIDDTSTTPSYHGPYSPFGI